MSITIQCGIGTIEVSADNLSLISEIEKFAKEMEEKYLLPK